MVCKEKRDTEATVTMVMLTGGRASQAAEQHVKRHDGGKDLEYKNVKTRPVWLELKEGVQKGEMRSQRWGGDLVAGASSGYKRKTLEYFSS